MSLANSLSKFKSELADTTTRNLQHARPLAGAGPIRSSTPKPGESIKRNHETAFTAPSSSGTSTLAGHSGSEILTQVVNAVKYLKEKAPALVTFEQLIGYLSLPNDAQKNIPYIKRALRENERVDYIPKSESSTGRESFKYRPLHPVTNTEELKNYLARLEPAQGIPVKELKDGFPDCISSISLLESTGHLLCIRNKKDNTPRTIFPDSPTYHITNASTGQVETADAEFLDVWAKSKLPASETEIRNELERAGLVPTSQVKETGGVGRVGKKERKRVVRRGGKQTNAHMIGILKDYSRK